MPKLSVKQGTTSKLVEFDVEDTSSSTGAGFTTLAYNSSGIKCYYYIEGAASAVAVTLATMTLGTWATGGLIVVDATNMPGLYQLGIPNLALASGKSVVIYITGVTNMSRVRIEIELTQNDNQDVVRGGMTALPNVVAAGTGGLPTVDASNSVKVQSGTGANQISLSSGLVTLAAVTHTGATIPTVTTVGTLTTYTGNTVQTGDSFARLGAAGAGLTALGDTRIANLDATVSSRVTPAQVTTSVGTAQTGDNFARIGAAGAGLTALGDTRIANLDAAITTRATPAQVATAVGTAQTGDNFARLGVAGAGLTALGDTRIANLDAAVTTRATPAQVSTAVGTAQTGDNFARIGAAGAGLTAIGDTRIANLDAAVTTRATPAQVDTTITANASILATKQMMDIFGTQSYAVTVVTPTSNVSMTVSGMPTGFTPLNGFAQFRGPTVRGAYLVTGFTAGSPATIQFGAGGTTAPPLAPGVGEIIDLFGRRS